MKRPLLAPLAPCAGAALALVFLLAASPAAAWKQDRFLIGGFGIGSATDTTRLVRLAGAGLDVVLNSDHWGSWSARQFVRGLDLLRARHAGFALRGIVSAKADPASERGEWRTELPDCGGPARRSRADDLSDNVHPDRARARAGLRLALQPGSGLASPSVLGWFLHDEPVLPEAMERAFWADTVVASAAARGLPYVNLVPPYVAEDAAPCVRASWRRQFGADRQQAYRSYLGAWLARFDSLPEPAPVLSADHYAYETPGRERSDYLFTLRALRDAAERHGRAGRPIPVWVVLQLSPRVTRGRAAATPTQAQCAYAACAALAHGAKAVLWWTLVPSPPYGAGLLDAAGNPAARYAGMRALHGRLRSAGDALFACDHVATFLADTLGQEGVADERPGGPGSLPGIVRAFARDAAGRSPRALLAGHLRARDRSADYLLVVNRDLRSAAGGRLVLGERAPRIERLDLANGRWTPVARDAAAIDVSPALEPGAAALYRLAIAPR